MSGDYKKRLSAARGNVTKVCTQIEFQAEIQPRRRDKSNLSHLLDLLARAEENYSSAYATMDEPSSEDIDAQTEFITNVFEARSRVNNLIQQSEVQRLIDILEDELEVWEDTDADELNRTFDEGHTRLQELYVKLKDSLGTPGASEVADFKQKSKQFRRRMSKLRETAFPEGPPSITSKLSLPSDGVDDSGSLRANVKARALPLPTFNGELADWRSFWRRFGEYTDKIKGLSDDERLSYLLESLKDSTAKQIVADAIRNGDKFDEVGELLRRRYDQPREVYLEALKGLNNLTTLDYTRNDLSALSRDCTKYCNILERYGDGTAEQVYTAIVESRMSPKLREEWRLYTRDEESIPQRKELVKFCNERELILQAKERSREKPSAVKSTFRPQYKHSQKWERSKQVSLLSDPINVCRLCRSGDHPLYYCDRFKEMDVTGRRQFLSNHPHCFNCLGQGHSARQCRSRRTCRDCGHRHHSLLHQNEPCRSSPQQQPPQGTNTQQPSSTGQTTPTANESSLSAIIPDKTALLWLCQVLVQSGNRTQIVRAIIDSGSTKSFLTERVANSMRLSRTSCDINVTGLQASHAATIKHKASITLKSPHDPDEPPVDIDAALVKNVTGDVTSADLLKGLDLSFTKNLRLADSNIQTPGGVDLLLGQDVLGEVMRHGFVKSFTSKLFAVNTMFGWVVGGYCSVPSDAVSAHICCHVSNHTETDALLRAFWEAEEPPAEARHLTEEEQDALQQFEEGVSRLPDGRYQVKLPKKRTESRLGHSRTQAVRRYQSNRKSLQRQGRWKEFSAAVAEYKEMDHSEMVPATDLCKSDDLSFYLPMHGVVKEASTSTKLRVVFDASAKSSSGYSLNDLLLTGSADYPLLTSILTRFRLPRVGLSADISKMFREVALHPGDRDLHRFLSEDKDGVLQDWRMRRLTFGVASSPFLATQVLRRLANDYAEEFPEAALAILNSFYVDDYLSGADSVEEATRLRMSLNLLLEKGKMTLRKWRTNSDELRQTIPVEILEKEELQTIQAPASCHKALGVHWNTSTDSLHVATPVLNPEDIPTKRQVLSDVARTFDILGWFSPVTVQLKVLLQQIWSLGLDWDQALPDELVKTWSIWRLELPLVTDFSIPRCYFTPGKEVQGLQLHGYCDASQLALSAVVYLRSMYCNTDVSISIVTAKTKVAPIRPQTIPKLELSAAVLLSKLLHTVSRELHVDLAQIYAWSDSTIALGWIRTHPSKLKTFVANRVVSITNKVPPVNWYHVPTADNPADVASRGTSASTLVQLDLWWCGPTWLQLSPDNWPAQDKNIGRLKLPELKTSALTIRAEPQDRESMICKFSNYFILLNVFSWIIRFSGNARKKKPDRNMTPYLSANEVRHAERALLHAHQLAFLAKELALLRSGSSVPVSSVLHSLHPFLGTDGLIRVGGRLKHSSLSFSQRHPVVLCRQSHLSLILVRHIHQFNQHAGPTLLMGLLSREYYILGARRLVRKVSRACVVCQRAYAKTSSQIMGDLPAARVNPSPPFATTGTDFAGPLILKKGHTRKPVMIKGYICLFVCLSTRAVHLELVSDLSTEAFLAAFSRFAARRGYPDELMSDNGTNYVGANRELARIYDLLTKNPGKNSLCRFFSDRRIKWTFIPGKAPHFGGLWEAGVKAAKTLLRKIMGGHPLTFEECVTVLTDVEATLNSRPLCPLETLPEDGIDVLTPGHFLVGRPLRAVPQGPTENMDTTPKKRWNLCKRMAAEFWERWTTEYLQILQRRQRWSQDVRNLQVGEVVLLKDQQLYCRTWPLAVIEETHPGPDGKVRAVTVRTSKGMYRRPVVKVVPLLIPTDKNGPNDKNVSSFPRGEDVQATS